MNLGWTEILLIGGIALLLFGPSKLPKLGQSLGEAIRGFKKGISEDPTDEREVAPQITENKSKPVSTETETETEKAKDPNKNS